jgi:hypothetical protein
MKITLDIAGVLAAIMWPIVILVVLIAFRKYLHAESPSTFSVKRVSDLPKLEEPYISLSTTEVSSGPSLNVRSCLNKLRSLC